VFGRRPATEREGM